MSDSYSEVSYQGWGGRIMDSIKGVLIGLVLVLVGVVVLFWNEGRAVKTAQGLEEAGKNVVTVSSDKVDPANDGKLIHFNATTMTPQKGLADAEFGVVAPDGALKLNRKVEMFQYKEEEKKKKEKKLGGGETTTTTYSYPTVWSEKPIDSSKFEGKEGRNHPNPPMPVRSTQVVAKPIMAGAYTLSDKLVEKLSDTESLPMAQVPAGEKAIGMTLSGGQLYKGTDPASPKVGDLRVTFSIIKSGAVSVIAKQVAGKLEAYATKSGTEVLELRSGTLTSAQIIAAAQAENATLTWILRLVGFIVTTIGFALVLKPLVVVADVVPLFGNLLEFGTLLAAGVAGLAVSLVTIAIAWLFYRPMLSIGLFVVIAAVVWFIRQRGKARKQERLGGSAFAGAGAGGPGGYPPPPPPPVR